MNTVIQKNYIAHKLYMRGSHLVKAPFCMPELPMPAIARPTMSIFDEMAMPHISDPSSKTKKVHRKVHWVSVHEGLSSWIIRNNSP